MRNGFIYSLVFFLTGFIFFLNNLNAQSVGDFQTFQSGNWGTNATWSRWDGSAWINPAPSIPTSTNGVITILSGHNVVFDANRTVDQLIIDAGGILTLPAANRVLTLANGTGDDLTVNGLLINQSTNATPIAINAGAVLIVGNGGTYRHARNGGPVPTATWSTGSTCEITGVVATIPTVTTLNQAFYHFTWNCAGQTVATPTLAANLTTINGDLNVQSTGTGLLRLATTESPTITVGGNMTVSGGQLQLCTTGSPVINLTGGLIVSGGTLSLSAGTGHGTINTGGNLNVSGGTLTESSTGYGAIVFNGTAAQSYSVAGTVSGTIDYTIDNSAGVTLNNTVTMERNLYLYDGTFTIGANLTMATAATITRTGGSLSATPTFAGTVNVVYPNHTASVTTGNELPSGAAVLNNITLDNPNGITLDKNVTVNGTFYFGRGSITAGVYAFSYNPATANLSYNSTGGAQTTTDFEFPAVNGPRGLIINNASGVTLHDSRTLAGVLTLTSGTFDISNRTLTLSGGSTAAAGSSLSVNSSTSLVVNTAGTAVLRFTPGSESLGSLISNRPMTIASGFNIAAGGTWNQTASTVTLNSGTTTTIYGTLTMTGTSLITTTGTLVVANGGVLNYARNGGTVPTCTWQTGSTCQVTGITTSVASNWDQTYYHFYWNCPAQAASAVVTWYQPGDYDRDVLGNFTIESTGAGRFRFETYSGCGYANKTMTVYGDFTMNGGTIEIFNVAGCANRGTEIRVVGDFTMTGGRIYETNIGWAGLAFIGTSQQNFIKTGGTLCSGADNGNCLWIRVASGAIVNFGTYILDGGDSVRFNLGSGATGIFADPGGIALTGNTGNIRVGGSRVYNTAANYTYNGTVAQITGTGLPATVNNFTINNTAGVSLTSALTVNGIYSNASGSIFNTALNFILNGTPNTNTGTTNVNPGGLLRINAAKTLNSSGTININSTSAGHGSFIDYGTFSNSGTFNVQRYLAGVSYKPYHYISSPVNGGTYSNIWSAGDYNIYWYDETVLNKDLDYGWTRFLGGTMVNGMGYAVVRTSDRTSNFSGNPILVSSMPFSKAVTNSGYIAPPSNRLPADGWNLIGNPFPCALNIVSFLNDNSAIIDPTYGAVYFWNDVNGVYDTSTAYRTVDYATHNLTGGTAASGSGVVPINRIALGQGFFIKVNTTGTVSFTSGQRTSNTSSQFFIPDITKEVQRVHLGIHNPDNYFNSTLVGLTDNATDDYDPFYDAVKFKGNPQVSLYTLLDGKDLAIQAIPALVDEEQKVYLGFDAWKAGIHRIKLIATENLETVSNIYLIDKYTNTTTSLFLNPEYSFYSGVGMFRDRFEVVFVPKLQVASSQTKSPGKTSSYLLGEDNSTGLTENTNIEPDAYKSGNQIVITGKSSIPVHISVFDPIGKILYSDEVTLEDYLVLPDLNLSRGIYFIRMQFATKEILKKVMF